MKRLGLLISLFLFVLSVNSVNAAACVAPVGPNFDSCPTTNNKVSCYIRNDATGVPDLTCCATQKDCDERQPTGETHDFTGTGTQLSTSPSNQGNIFCGTDGKNINTALGCISVEGTGFVTTLLNFGIGIAGGIAMLLIIFGGFQILTSAGNPERLNEGKELISSAITGLLMIIFSVFLLRIIGINILGIPQFK